MKIVKELILREIAGDVILVPVGNTVLENNGLFVMNSVSADIWKLLSDGLQLEQIITAMMELYDVPEDVIRADTEKFLDYLIQRGIVEP